MDWTEKELGLTEIIGKAATATDEQGKLGWIYGGEVATESQFLNGTEEIGFYNPTPLNALYSYNLTSMTVKKVAPPNTIDLAVQGEMVYIPNVGEKGVLILVGGHHGDVILVGGTRGNVEMVRCLTVVYSSHHQHEGSQHGN